MTAPAADLPTLTVSRFDLERLERLLDRVGGGGNLDLLRQELDRAEVVEPCDVPPDVVTMNSQVRVRDEATGEESDLRLVFPAASDAEKGAVSILAPIGSALLGLRVSAAIKWPMPDGRMRRIRIVAVPYQPEAAGELHL